MVFSEVPKQFCLQAQLKHFFTELTSAAGKGLSTNFTGNLNLFNDCRCQEEDLVVAMDSTTGRILQCEKTVNKKRFSFPLVRYSLCLFHLTLNLMLILSAQLISTLVYRINIHF